jgi:hypothetical protein
MAASLPPAPPADRGHLERPFGAARLVEELVDVAGITAFFREGARLAARSRT